MLSAARRAPAPRPARGPLIALPLRAAPPPLAAAGSRRSAGAATAASLLLHAVLLAVGAWQVVIAPADPPPITVTLLGTPDSGGSPATALAPVAPLAATATRREVARVSRPVAAPAPRPRPAPDRARPQPAPRIAEPRRPQPAASAPPAAAPVPADGELASGGVATSGSGASGRGGGGGAGVGTAAGRAPGAQGDPTGSAVAGYLRRLRARLESVKRYPTLARRRGSIGTATLRIVIGRDGRPASVTLKRSSGSTVLDEEAEEMVGRAAPFDPLPVDLAGETLQITVPVRFDVNG